MVIYKYSVSQLTRKSLNQEKIIFFCSPPPPQQMDDNIQTPPSLPSYNAKIRYLGTQVAKKLPKSLLTYFLFCVFGIGSWVAINGIWAEISILILTLPECYKLPSILVVIIQLANIGPLVYSIAKYVSRRAHIKQLHLEVITVYILVAVGTVASVLLAIFWSDTAEILGSVHSVALIVLTFFLALVDCTSTLVFIPFLQHFPAEYISGLYIGEGLSGVLASIVALSQGFVNNSIGCVQEYPGHQALGIRFSPNVYFVFLGIMMLVCGTAFTLINTLPSVRRHMIASQPYERVDEGSTSVSSSSHSEDGNSDNGQQNQEGENSETQGDLSESPLLEPEEQICGVSITNRKKSFSISNGSSTDPQTQTLRSMLKILRSNLTILISFAVVNFLTNGALSAISSYAFQPYGNSVYHIGINLGLLTAPLAAGFYHFLPSKSRALTAVLTAISCALGVYVLVIALLSPHPLLQNSVAGKILIVSCVTVLYSATPCRVQFRTRVIASPQGPPVIPLTWGRGYKGGKRY